MSNITSTSTFQSITCPACGLLCDDIHLARNHSGKLSVTQNGCQRSISFFSRAALPSSAKIKGNPVSLDEAVAHAAKLLSASKQPLFAGLGTDVNGMRSIMRLADNSGAVLDHMNTNGLMRNIQTVQNSGWQVTTLTEVRNRVDLLLIIGTDVVSVLPRFFERVVWNKESMFGQDTSQREVVYLGGRDLDISAGTSPDGRKPQALPCDVARLPEVVSVLRALVSGKKLHATEVAGIAISDLQNLSERLSKAQYSVLAWAPPALNFPHAELTVQNIADLVKTLNKTTRSSGLPLGGSDGDMSANQVCTWISGYPLRTSYARTYPEHDPYHFSTDYLLANDEADFLLWVSSFNPERTPPATNIPTVVLGHSTMSFEREPEVFIPIATPGIDHSGILFRMDNVVSLPVEQLRASELPTLSVVISAIEKAVTC
ncbi:MAG: formylmethanofuran dehydrogenase subunit B [Methylophilales bacterium]|nr:formylmethanofuran dehydrogenase subunit B [Methylophilales bacterium]